MTTALPAPLVPADIDLRDFSFMPLDVRRLRDSGLMTERSAEEIVAAVLLWAASWHQVPASSLPENEKQLCQFAGYGRGVKEFQRISEGAMHRFVKCSDGRWYHPVVAEKAAEGWNAKIKEEHKRAIDRIRKENKARDLRHEPPLPIPDYPQLLSMRNVDGFPCWRVWGSNGSATHSDGSDSGSDGNVARDKRNSRLKRSEGKLRDRDIGVKNSSPTRVEQGQGQQLLRDSSFNSTPSATVEENRETARRLATGELKVGSGGA